MRNKKRMMKKQTQILIYYWNRCVQRMSKFWKSKYTQFKLWYIALLSWINKYSFSNISQKHGSLLSEELILEIRKNGNYQKLAMVFFGCWFLTVDFPHHAFSIIILVIIHFSLILKVSLSVIPHSTTYKKKLPPERM